VDTPAEVRRVVGTLKHGDRVEIIKRTRYWAQIRLPDHRSGWVEGKDLVDPQTYEQGERLLREVLGVPVQATGHTTGLTNLRVEPSRAAPQLAQLEPNQKLEIFGRRLADRPLQTGQTLSGAREAWYLVRADSRAGWVLGRLVALDIPEALVMFAHGINLVAWLVLNTVEDGGRQVPQYLVADRIGTQEVDFNHIRVFTWWPKRQQYVTAYVESNLAGYFPIRVFQVEGIPHFRLRLMSKDGRQFQKVYRLADTITRPLGTVEGWESDALPSRPVSRARRRP